MSIRVVRSQHVHGDWWYQTLVVDPFMWKNVRYLGAEFFPMIRWLWFENKTWGSKGLFWISTYNRQHAKNEKKWQNIQRILITFINPHKHKTVIIHIIDPRAQGLNHSNPRPPTQTTNLPLVKTDKNKKTTSMSLREGNFERGKLEHSGALPSIASGRQCFVPKRRQPRN